ncbi:hypothetical protein GCM10027454_11800 [Algoriphagus aestuariicola]
MLLFILTLNFINLSANFYEGDIFVSNKIDLDDPMDTISELLVEWAFDLPEDFIPDNGTQQEDQGGEKIKLAIVDIPGFTLMTLHLETPLPDLPTPQKTSCGHLSSPSLPPDFA